MGAVLWDRQWHNGGGMGWLLRMIAKSVGAGIGVKMGLRRTLLSNP
jgi:hypothetical protein